MKNKIYRSVSVEERLPKHGGHFLSNIGLVRFMISDKEWVDDDYRTRNPDWFLEEIELPSEEDLSYDMGMPPRKGSDLWWHYQGFKNGANFIINHIKGGGK